jgi:hypothetical protein
MSGCVMGVNYFFGFLYYESVKFLGGDFDNLEIGLRILRLLLDAD